MTPETRSTVLFWLTVSLGLTGMLLMFGMLACLIFFTIAQIRTLDENRARDKAMLQQHYEAMQAHEAARQQHEITFARTVQAFDAILDNHKRFIHSLER